MVVRSESEATLREGSKRVLKNLREQSPTRSGDDGEKRIEMNLGKLCDENAAPLAFKDPHAARVFAEMMPPKVRTYSDQLGSDSNSLNIRASLSRNQAAQNLNPMGSRPSKPRMSKRASLFDTPIDMIPQDDNESEAEDKEHMVAEAGHSKYILR